MLRKDALIFSCFSYHLTTFSTYSLQYNLTVATSKTPTPNTMYFTKLISIALAATVATVAAAPFQLQERQSSACQQALAELSQASAYYESVAAQWVGEAAV